MTCQNVGPTNPDIAGLGIVIAFAFQAGLSLVLSCWSLSLWRSAHLSWITDIGPSLFQLDFPLFDLIEQLQQAISRRSPESKARRLLEILVPELKGQPLENHPLFFDLKDLVQQAVSKRLPESKARRLLEILIPGLKGHQDDDDISPSFWAEGVRWACKKRAIDKVLSIISDVQIMNALAILLAALVQYESISLYHLRIVYETVSFTTISVCACLINVSSLKDEMKRTRAISLALFVVAYISFFVIFCIQLGKWDKDLPGRCYNTQFVASPSDAHPLSDCIYFGITFAYSLSALLSCYRSGATFHFLARIFSRSSTAGRLLPTTSGAALRPSSSSVPLISDNRFWARFSPVIGVVKLITGTGITSGLNVSRLVAIYFTVLVHEKPEYRVWAIVPLAMAQYPLHLYMTIALRAGNDSILSGDSENAWGFGQIVALILCAATLLECVKGFFEYRKIVQLQSDLEGSEVVLNEEIQARRRNSF